MLVPLLLLPAVAVPLSALPLSLSVAVVVPGVVLGAREGWGKPPGGPCDRNTNSMVPDERVCWWNEKGLMQCNEK